MNGGTMKHGLKDLIRSQQDHFDALLRLSGELLTLLRSGAPNERMDKILDERARLFESIAQLDAPLRKAVEDHPDAEHAALERLHTTVRNVVETDTQCQALLLDERSKVAEQMRAVSRGSAAMKWYGRKEDGGSRFISVKK